MSVTRYINTDLVLVGGDSVDALVAALEAEGLLHLTTTESNGRRRAVFESGEDQATAGASVDILLAALEKVDRKFVTNLDRMYVDIGFEAGTERFAFESELSLEQVTRIANLGLGLRATIYTR